MDVPALNIQLKPTAPLSMKLPVLPPEDLATTPPPPPAKELGSDDTRSLDNTIRPLPKSPPEAVGEQVLEVPGSQTSPPPTPLSAGSKPKKSNPLLDLVDTEVIYVDQLSGIIRKVAAAWSRSNLPPKELDDIFRSIEAVFMANRSLLMSLKEIGTNPASPKALGDLLMRWIDDLEKPYTNYTSRYLTGFDTWAPILANPKIPAVLAKFSETNPPPLSAITTPLEPGDAPTWTLDALFLLPKYRIKYYRKLYNRLLKSTTPGRSDHRLLLSALEKLDKLLATLDERSSVQVGGDSPSPSLPSVSEPTLSVASPPQIPPPQLIDTMTSGPPTREPLPPIPKTNGIDFGPSSDLARGSERGGSSSSSKRGSLSSGDPERSSRETEPTSVSQTSEHTVTAKVSDLESRLSTAKVIDIFTMKPKPVRLQMSPPSLTYTREIRKAVDAFISVVPKATGTEVVHRHGHVFILSDLFLVCERMTPSELAKSGPGGPEMYLCYPPLAGKVLRVSESPSRDDELQVLIMRKETLTLRLDSKATRDELLYEFKQCISFAGAVPPASKTAPPPIPQMPSNLPTFTTSPPPAESRIPSGDISQISGPPSIKSAHTSLASSVALDQASRSSSQSMSKNDGRPDDHLNISIPLDQPLIPRKDSFSGGSAISSRSRSPLPPSPAGQTSFTPGQIVSSPQNIHPGQGPNGAGPSFIPGQVVPPLRQNSLGPRPPQPPGPPRWQGPPGSNPAAYGQRGPSPIPPGSRPPGSYPPPHSGAGYQPNNLPQRSASAMSANGPRPSASSPGMGGGYNPGVPRPGSAPGTRSNSYGSPGDHPARQRPLLPSAQMRTPSYYPSGSFQEPSPPGSPVEETPRHTGPLTSSIAASMKCKVFLKQHHAQWKNLGSCKLKLYRQMPTNIKQLVVESDDKNSSVIISTIVLADGVERVGKTGIAVELSDRGERTGIVYMIQCRNEKSTGGLYDCLLAGSDRTT